MEPDSRWTDYERAQWTRILHWRDEPPSAATRSFARASNAASRAVGALVPASALRAALELVQGAAERTADRRSILRRAGADDLAALRQGALEQCDRLAVRESRTGTLLGGSSGAALGLAGGLGLTLDVPTLLVITFRTVVRIGLCYGQDCSTERLRVLGVFALASANTLEEKQAALEVLARAGDPGMAVRNGLERTAERELAKEALQFSFRRLSQQFTERLGWRLGAGALPIVGAAVGGGVNAWFLHEVTVAARHCFQAQWLEGKYLNALAP